MSTILKLASRSMWISVADSESCMLLFSYLSCWLCQLYSMFTFFSFSLLQHVHIDACWDVSRQATSRTGICTLCMHARPLHVCTSAFWDVINHSVAWARKVVLSGLCDHDQGKTAYVSLKLHGNHCALPARSVESTVYTLRTAISALWMLIHTLHD